MSFFGCQGRKPTREVPTNKVCEEWNSDQWQGYHEIVQESVWSSREYNLAVLAIGAMLKKCWPEKFEGYIGGSIGEGDGSDWRSKERSSD